MWFVASRKVASFLPAASTIGSSNSRLQPDLRSDVSPPGELQLEASARRKDGKRPQRCRAGAAYCPMESRLVWPDS